MKHIYILLCLFLNLFLQPIYGQTLAIKKSNVNKSIDTWYSAAQKYDEDVYFKFVSSDCIFLKAKKNKNLNNSQLKAALLPEFKKSKTIKFTSNKRTVYFTDSEKFAWFKEELETPKGKYKATGVMTEKAGIWQVRYFKLVPSGKSKKHTDYVGLFID